MKPVSFASGSPKTKGFRRRVPTSRRCWISCRNSIATRARARSWWKFAGSRRRPTVMLSGGGFARWRRCWCWPRRNWIKCFGSRARRILLRCRWRRCARWDRRTHPPIWVCGSIAFRPSAAAVAESPESAAAVPGVALRGFATRAEESAAIADMIAEQAERHPDWRIAVLVRARAHAREIAAGLRAKRIGFRAVDIEPLQDRAIVRDIIMLACALLHLGDRTAWLAVLRAPWAGICL